LPERPEFPPPSLNLVPAFAADLPQKQGSDILMVAAFLQSFSGLLGLSSVTVDNLLAAGQHLMTLHCLLSDFLAAYASTLPGRLLDHLLTVYYCCNSRKCEACNTTCSDCSTSFRYIRMHALTGIVQTQLSMASSHSCLARSTLHCCACYKWTWRRLMLLVPYRSAFLDSLRQLPKSCS